MSTKFKDLEIGDIFDFIDDNDINNSFFKTCQKISARRYRCSSDYIYNVGSINCFVFHIVKKGDKEHEKIQSRFQSR